MAANSKTIRNPHKRERERRESLKARIDRSLTFIYESWRNIIGRSQQESGSKKLHSYKAQIQAKRSCCLCRP